MNWNEVINKAEPYVVRIDTPSGFGTGYLCGYNEDKSFCTIATALHVVREADYWQQPMRIHNHNFGKTVFLKETDRVIFTNDKNDSAVILCPPQLDLPQALIELRPIKSPLSIGAEIGWLGFPALEPFQCCFFSGNISARMEDRSQYLIDGVAINGVSGGPVLYPSQTDGVQFVGVVSAYRANRMTGETLPGLLVAQDVSHFHEVISQIRTRDEALKKRAEIEASRPATPPQQSTIPQKPSIQKQEDGGVPTGTF